MMRFILFFFFIIFFFLFLSILFTIVFIDFDNSNIKNKHWVVTCMKKNKSVVGLIPLMLVAISGTPGTGKTSVCRHLQALGYHTVSVDHLASLYPEIVAGYDRKRRVKEIYTYKTSKLIRRLYKDTRIVFIDSHFSHLLRPDKVIVLRCHPSKLRTRLKAKRYTALKIKENLEAEACDVITIESLQLYGKDKMYEIDTTKMSPKDTTKAVIDIIDGTTHAFEPGQVDFSEEILNWY